MIKIEKNIKSLESEFYSYKFNMQTGFFVRMKDPGYSPFGPEILDLEISSGICAGKCSFCYKQNNVSTEVKNMKFEAFKHIVDNIGEQLTQIAFGITDIYTNPDFFKMMAYAREKNIIPNYTTNGISVDDNCAKETAKYCGAVAVSIDIKNPTKVETALKAIETYNKNGMTNINIHFMLSQETVDYVEILIQLLQDRKVQYKSIVFLQYKNKANLDNFHSVNTEIFKNIIQLMEKYKISYGFDSCSSSMYFKALDELYPDLEEKKKRLTFANLFVESCESTLFSSYINVEGKFYPCSFSEFGEGLDVLKTNNFLKDIWFNPITQEFRKKLCTSTLKSPIEYIRDCRLCPTYNSVNAWSI